MSPFFVVMAVLVWFSTVTGAYLSGRKHESESAWNGGHMKERDRHGNECKSHEDRIATALEWIALGIFEVNDTLHMIARNSAGMNDEDKAAIVAATAELKKKRIKLQHALDSQTSSA